MSQPKGRVGIIASGGKKSHSTTSIINFLQAALAMVWQSLYSNHHLPVPDTLFFTLHTLHYSCNVIVS